MATRMKFKPKVYHVYVMIDPRDKTDVPGKPVYGRIAAVDTIEQAMNVIRGHRTEGPESYRMHYKIFRAEWTEITDMLSGSK